MKKRFITLILAFGLACSLSQAVLCAANTPSDHSAERSPEEIALRTAAAKGDQDAMYALAVALIEPIAPEAGPIKEGKEAAELLEKCVEVGSADAAFLLGYMHQYATGVERDIPAALSWLKKAADMGNDSALVTLGTIYRKGDGVVRDRIKARDYYAKAAQQDNLNAMTSLGLMYMDGDGVHRDGKLAQNWLRRAASRGHAPAMVALGKLYASKDLSVLNGPKAIYWTHKAIGQGHLPGVYALGILYRDGVGSIQPDAYTAYLWLGLTFELAEDTGEVPYWFENAARVLTPEQRKKADAELDRWLKNGPPSPPAKEPE